MKRDPYPTFRAGEVVSFQPQTEDLARAGRPAVGELGGVLEDTVPGILTVAVQWERAGRFDAGRFSAVPLRPREFTSDVDEKR